MRVLCMKHVKKSDEWSLTIGKEYLVLEILFIEGEPEYRTICDDGRPFSFSASQFDITDSAIPTNWLAVKTEYGQLWLSPKRWADNSLWQYSFWEDYFSDDDVKAKQVFEEEVAKMMKEDEENAR